MIKKIDDVVNGWEKNRQFVMDLLVKEWDTHFKGLDAQKKKGHGVQVAETKFKLVCLALDKDKQLRHRIHHHYGPRMYK